jgi:AbrB family looped-hinge helix DNA binding protein
MKITSKGQVTIPLEIRNKMGLMPHTEVEFRIKGNVVQLIKKEKSAMSRGKRLTEGMRGKATVKMSTDEIMAVTRGEG